ncbi:hypothetical protein ACTJIL_04850 [Luteimonas sp. 22616]|uniref:hypothetical protein n=1 Tax=Luteimonas sp. 22616 TaxID=3453951 RepID=UPI003F84F968
MRWLLRVAASAAVRRLVYLAIAALIGLLAMCGKAQAQYVDCFTNATSGNCETRQDAYGASQGAAESFRLGTGNPSAFSVVFVFDQRPSPPSGSVRYAVQRISDGATLQTYTRSYVAGCPVGKQWDEGSHSCLDTRCADSEVVVTSAGARGTLQCQFATGVTGDPVRCEYIAQTIAPGQPNSGYVGLVPTGATCDLTDPCPSGGAAYDQGVGTFDQHVCYPKKECAAGVPVDPVTGNCTTPDTCPEGKEKGPDGACREVANDCPGFGTVKGPDGSCVDDPNICKPGTAKGGDGTCKPDTDGDGVPDEDDGTHKATDAVSCVSPPVCSGDEIMCLHAKQLWRIDCNTRKNANVVLDQYCNAPPVCEKVALGDDNRTTGCSAAEEAGLYLQWRQVCETEKSNEILERIAENGKTGGSSCGPGTMDTDCNGQPDWTQNPADGLGQAGLSDPGEAATPADVVVEGDAIGTGGLNVTGFGYGSTCPTIPDVTINGQTLHFDTSVFCNWLRLGGQFVLIAAALLSLSIMTRGQG